MNKKIAVFLAFGVVLLAAAIGTLAGLGGSVPVLEPKGIVGEKERNLLLFGIGLSLIVVLPVYVLTFFIALKYRAGNKKAKYRPELHGSRMLETIWWGVPAILIIILSVITFKSSHDLDPFKPLESTENPLRVQVVALQWKWLFIYPDHGVASVNEVVIPEDRPINFEITADAPMNSFWIPALGGQIYAMSGMSTMLHLMADEPGEYRGSSANISGRGFANMTFKAKAVKSSEFESWLIAAAQSEGRLDMDEYRELAKPGDNVVPRLYASSEEGLYDAVLAKYLIPNSALGGAVL